MRKANKKTDLVIIIVLILLAAAAILSAIPAFMPGDKAAQQQSAPLTPEDYAHRTFGIVTGTVFEDLTMEHFPEAEYMYYNSISDLVLALKNNKIDAFLGDEPVLSVICSEHPEIGRFPDKLTDDKYAFAFRKDDERASELCGQFNEMLKRYEADGTLKEMTALWTGTDDSAKTVDLSSSGENGKVTVITSAVNMPFSYVIDDKTVGYSVDLAARFCREYGYELEMGTADLASLIPGITSGKYDLCADSLTVTKERMESVLFSDTIYTGGIAMAVRARISVLKQCPLREAAIS